jgi:hypothetical protein
MTVPLHDIHQHRDLHLQMLAARPFSGFSQHRQCLAYRLVAKTVMVASPRAEGFARNSQWHRFRDNYEGQPGPIIVARHPTPRAKMRRTRRNRMVAFNVLDHAVAALKDMRLAGMSGLQAVARQDLQERFCTKIRNGLRRRKEVQNLARKRRNAYASGQLGVSHLQLLRRCCLGRPPTA